MATTVVIPEVYWTLVLAVFVFSFFSVFDRFGILQGVGGRLGTTALLSCLLMLPVLYWVVPGYHHTFWRPERYEDIDWVFGLAAFVLSTLSSIATILLRAHVKTLEHPVPAAAVCALCTSFILLSIKYDKNELLLVYVYIGMSVGMSGRDVIKNYPTYIILGFITGGLGLAFHGLSTGDNGGKAGFTAMVGVVTWQWIVLPIWRRVRDYVCPCFASSSYSSFTVRGRRKSILSDLEEPVLSHNSAATSGAWTSPSKRISEDRDIENEIRGRLAAEGGAGLEEVASFSGHDGDDHRGYEGGGGGGPWGRPRGQSTSTQEVSSIPGSSSSEGGLLRKGTSEGEGHTVSGYSVLDDDYYDEEEEHEALERRRDRGAGGWKGRAGTVGAMSVEEDIGASIDGGHRGMGSKF